MPVTPRSSKKEQFLKRERIVKGARFKTQTINILKKMSVLSKTNASVRQPLILLGVSIHDQKQLSGEMVCFLL